MDNRVNIERVKEASDIVNVVGKYVKLKQAGKNSMGLCPFHQEKTPSFTVSPGLQIYKCFGCGKAGDVINFVQDIERIEFSEALEKLAKEAGITIVKTVSKPNPIEEINEMACRYFQKSLLSPQNKQALKYLHDRGMDEECITKFRIGYSSGEGNLYSSFKKYKNFTDFQLQQSGLFVLKNGRIREKFLKRIVFPIFSTAGKVIAFTGRILPGNDFGPKYLNSPETSIFRKKDVLYGLNFNKSGIRKEDLCIILEGTTDVISANKAGIDYTVAPLGTGLTAEQLKLISRYTRNILFLFDSDFAGQKALERAFKIASSLNLNTYATNTGKYKDLDEMIKEDIGKVKGLIKNKSDCFSYLISNFVENLDLTKLTDFSKISRYVEDILEGVKDEMMKSFYISKAKKITGIDFQSSPSFEKEMVVQKKNRQHNSLELMYLKAFLNEFPKKKFLKHNPEYFSDENIKEILSKSIKNDFTKISELLKSFEKNLGIVRLIEETELSTLDISGLDAIYMRIEKAYYENQLNTLRVKLAAKEEKRDTTEVNKILKEIVEITNKMKSYKT